MIRTWTAVAALALATVPAAAAAQEGPRLDCVVVSAGADMRAALGTAMAGDGDEASREALFKQFGSVVDQCAASQAIPEASKSDYFDYGLARISREWLLGALAAAALDANVVDKALDFGLDKSNPDLSGEMSDEQIMKIVQAFVDAGVNIDAVDQKVWEKVGAYAAATSIYWNKRKKLPF